MTKIRSQYRDETVVPLESETLKFVSPRTSHYASNYHYPSQSIAFSGYENAELAGRSQ